MQLLLPNCFALLIAEFKYASVNAYVMEIAAYIRIHWDFSDTRFKDGCIVFFKHVAVSRNPCFGIAY